MGGNRCSFKQAGNMPVAGVRVKDIGALAGKVLLFGGVG